VNTEQIHAVLLTWFAEYGELGDLCAEQAESTDDDPTLADAILDQMETCLGVASQVIALLGRHVLDAAGADPQEPVSVMAGDGSEYVKPPF